MPDADEAHPPHLSFDRFWLDHRDSLVRALAVTLGDVQLAADAVDEAMARAFQRWNQVAALDRPASWVFRVALNWSRSLHRRLRRTPPAWLSPTSVDAVAPGEPSIDVALASLSVDHRAVVACRLLLGMSEADTAATLKVPHGTVKSRLARATSQLATSLAHLDPKEQLT